MKKELGNFHSVEYLKNWLRDQSIDLDKWNCGRAKSVDNLFDEINKGESSLQIQPPLRVVKVVQVLIFQGKSILVELEQEFNDYRIRKRNLPPSEKIKPGEDCLVAARRCLNEELQIPIKNIEINKNDCQPLIRYRKSRSYPGLKSKYYIYRVEAAVIGLPTGNFWSDEKSKAGEANIIHRHHWGWRNLTKIKYPD